MGRLFRVRKLTWHVGDVVYKLRSEKGWTQIELATRADVNKATISRIEDAATDIKTTTLTKIAQALDVRPEDLYALIPREPPASTEEARERDALWSVIPARSYEEALRTLRRLAQLGVQGQVTQPPDSGAHPETPGRDPETPPTSPPEK